MSDNTSIEWADTTWSPLLGCDRVSPGCDNCYAITQAHIRAANPHPRVAAAFAGLTERTEHGVDWTGRINQLPDRLTQPFTWRKPRKVFVNSLADLFHDGVSDEFIARVWQVMSVTPQHTYQILTKRHARMRSWVTRWYSGEIAEPYDVRPVPGYPGYSVTTRGEVFGKRSDTTAGLTQEEGRQGHCRVTMHREGSPRSGEREFVHRLVLAAFVRPPVPGEQACHRNGDPTDNRLSNLYWGTQADNWRDRRSHGNGRSYHKLSVEDVAEIRRRYGAGESAYRIAQDYPVSDTQIRNVISDRQWRKTPVDVPTPAPARVVLDHCWLGVSVEDQKRADLRIPALLASPAAVRWISAEPLLGPVDLTRISRPSRQQPELVWDVLNQRYGVPGRWQAPMTAEARLDWVVVGGESGPGARPMHPEWARSLRDQCTAAGVAYLFKQWGAWGLGARHPEGEDGPGDMFINPDGETGHVWFNEDLGYPTNYAGPWGEGSQIVSRVGKKRAGRELDGQTWDEFPTTRTAVA